MRKADSGRRKCFCLSSVFAALMVLRIQDSMSEGPGSRVFSGFSSSLRNPKAWSLVAASTWTPHCYCSTVAASPITRSRKIFLASYQCVPADPPPRRLPGRVLLTAGRANAGQHLSPTRRRRKASSNSLPAFWIESNRSVPQDGIRLACRSPHVPSFQAQRACAGLDGRVNKFVTFHPTGKRGCGGPPGHCELGPAVVQCGASGDQRKASRLRLCSALRFCSFTIPPKTHTTYSLSVPAQTCAATAP